MLIRTVGRRARACRLRDARNSHLSLKGSRAGGLLKKETILNTFSSQHMSDNQTGISSDSYVRSNLGKDVNNAMAVHYSPLKISTDPI